MRASFADMGVETIFCKTEVDRVSDGRMFGELWSLPGLVLAVRLDLFI